MMKKRVTSLLSFGGIIKEILWEDWDPIGIKTYPSAEKNSDEYDMYVPEVYALLNSGKNVDDLSSHLMSIEIEQIGLTPGAEEEKRVHEVAKKLHIIWKEHQNQK